MDGKIRGRQILKERLGNHTCTATCTCSGVLDPVSVILQ